MKQYIGHILDKIAGVITKKEEEQSEEEYRGLLLAKGVWVMLFAFAALAIVRGAMIALPGSITVSSSVNGKESPIYCVETAKKQVALTFDAAGGNQDMERILKTLKKHDIHTTFFATGGWVEKYPEEVKAILAAGHDMGNQSESYKNMSQLSAAECQEEIKKAHTRVQELTGYEMFLFRPPYGDYDNKVMTSAKDCGYFSILWDVDSRDWKDYGVDAILKNVLENENLGNGSIIRCHCGAKYMSDALDSLIKGLKKQGYEIVPVSQLIYRERYHMNEKGRQMKN